MISILNYSSNISNYTVRFYTIDDNGIADYSSPSIIRPLPLKAAPLSRPDFRCIEIIKYYPYKRERPPLLYYPYKRERPPLLYYPYKRERPPLL
jgi:hypothetical protein